MKKDFLLDAGLGTPTPRDFIGVRSKTEGGYLTTARNAREKWTASQKPRSTMTAAVDGL
jgi:hypothetical protein